MIDERARLVRVAKGEEPADLVLLGGDVVSVYTGELLSGWGVAVAGRRVAAAGPDVRYAVGPDTEVIDCSGLVLTPGFMDPHTHLDILLPIWQYLRRAIPGGTTTIITEMAQITSSLGYSGARWFVDSLRDQPVKVYALAPTISYLTTDDGTGRPVISAEEMRLLLEDPQVLGLGEVYWSRVLDEPEKLLPLMAHCLALGKRVEGHSAGARGPKLAAYLAGGVSSCHEPVTPAEAIELLRLGAHVLIREGSVRRDLEAVAQIKDSGISLGRVTLASDGVWPQELVESGYMETIVQRAIDVGIPPITVLSMASLHVAEHHGLDGEVGGIAPGRYADILVLPSLTVIKPKGVIANGRVVAWEGSLKVEPRPHPFPPDLFSGLRLPGPVGPSLFALPAPGRGSRTTVRVIKLLADILTGEGTAELPVRNGAMAWPGDGRLLKVVALDRRGTGARAVGFVDGFGLERGAFASTLSFDTADLIAVGASDASLEAVVGRLVELRGGFAVADGDRVVAELGLPLGGVEADLPVEEVAARLGQIKSSLVTLGVRLANPFLTLQTLTFTAIPSLRITPRGLLHVKTNQTVDLIVNG